MIAKAQMQTVEDKTVISGLCWYASHQSLTLTLIHPVSNWTHWATLYTIRVCQELPPPTGY